MQGYRLPEGFIAVPDPKVNGSETDKRIVGRADADRRKGGRKAMENLLQKDPQINVVYTISGPGRAGAYEARPGQTATIVSVDGGCPGVKNIGSGVIGAPRCNSVADGLKVSRYPIHQNRQEVAKTPGLSFSTPASGDLRQAGCGPCVDLLEGRLKKCWG